jgi:hypothetical protein
VTLDIEAIRKRAEAATEGPMEMGPCRSIPNAPELFDVTSKSQDLYVAERVWEADGEFFSHAREDVLALLGVIANLQAELVNMAQQTAPKHLYVDTTPRIPLQREDGTWKTVDEVRIEAAEINSRAEPIPPMKPLTRPDRFAMNIDWPTLLGAPESDRPIANQSEVERHAEKQDCSYADAWRYFEREGYDMSEVAPQY